MPGPPPLLLLPGAPEGRIGIPDVAGRLAPIFAALLPPAPPPLLLLPMPPGAPPWPDGMLPPKLPPGPAPVRR
jgi:hypothetical protein